MKKYLSILVVAVFALALTGCGNSLKCTYEKDGSKSTVTVYFSGDKANKAVFESTYDAGSAENAKTVASYYESDKDTTVKVNGSKVTIKSTSKPDKDDERPTKKEVKESFEKSGYKCK